MKVRDHEPIVFQDIKGLWNRGDVENTPLDHLAEANNLINTGDNITVRPGIGLHQSVAVPLEDVRRMYNYPTATGNTLIVLTVTAGVGNIYHVVDSTTVFGPVLTVTGMTDFAFVPYAGRAYISPFTSYTTGDLNIEKGLQSEVLYVYAGDGTSARAAAGAGPTNTALTVANGAAGHTDAGFHIFATVFEYNSGYLSPPSQFTAFTTLASNSVSFAGIQTSGSSNVSRVHIVATKVITSYNGNLEGYQFYFIPGASVTNGTTVLNNVSFFDLDLLEDASYLIDNYTSIPAGAAMWLYHDRLCLATTYDNISIVLVSTSGEPEAINQITGLIQVPPDGNPITNGAELRDILYIFKRSRTTSYTDTGTEPSEWPDSPIDAAIGTCVHGVASVLDSGNTSVDFLIICTYTGVLLFNGRYVLPELSFKIQQTWRDLDRNEYRKIQIINSPTQKWILIVLPDASILVADWNSGMDPKHIEWWPWTFNVPINCIALVNIDQVIIGSPIYEGPF